MNEEIKSLIQISKNATETMRKIESNEELSVVVDSKIVGYVDGIMVTIKNYWLTRDYLILDTQTMKCTHFNINRYFFPKKCLKNLIHEGINSLFKIREKHG